MSGHLLSWSKQKVALLVLGSSSLAFGIWHLSGASSHNSSELYHIEADILAALDQEAALTTGKIWAEGSDEQLQQ
ncbi:hypothetical protein OEZ85_000048 [Tetradesmus obliquus]|uniref:Uncharacterized protein n=1 Tax=Tetradesmus obliquus TaxID=3088 RepID=A0ABY8UNY3_TETOB|nr:hypothetical protein OEZ85_000048 [Tetradesmus obliquus]